MPFRPQRWELASPSGEPEIDTAMDQAAVHPTKGFRMKESAAVILAAGRSTRMVTDQPKVLHEACGRPMLAYVLDACREAGVKRILAVVGYRKDDVIAAMSEDYPEVIWVEQAEQKGTGHAVMSCRDDLADFDGNVLIIAGDMPLVRVETLKQLIAKHEDENSAVTLATAELDDPAGYGRILRDAYGNLQGIIEHTECNDTQLKIREVNPSYYCFDAQRLREALDQIRPDNVKGEYYLTDALHILIHSGHRAAAITAVAPAEAIGVNSRQQLAEVSKLMQYRIQENLMNAGVSIVDPPNTWIDARAQIGQDTTIHPFTYIHGRVKIGRCCSIGPFAYLREGTNLKDNVVVGVFTEIKNSTIGSDTVARHLAYIGDAEIGQRVNIGAGTIFANYDGSNINNAKIEDDVFIGSGVTLISPIDVRSGEHLEHGTVVHHENQRS
jgi:bifunctional UDP-N-acetylglucosamine pyrophosphorylase/glucosamine-1-phosphate N-acetyltransferase